MPLTSCFSKCQTKNQALDALKVPGMTDNAKFEDHTPLTTCLLDSFLPEFDDSGAFRRSGLPFVFEKNSSYPSNMQENSEYFI